MTTAPSGGHWWRLMDWWKCSVQVPLYLIFIIACSPEHWRMEHRPSKHTAGYGGAGMWDRHWGCQHSILVFWHVEDNLCLAHWRHGPLQHQLLALRAVQVLVSHFVFLTFYECDTNCHLKFQVYILIKMGVHTYIHTYKCIRSQIKKMKPFVEVS